MTTIRKIIIEPAPAQARQAHSPLPWDVGDSRMIYDDDAREVAVPYGKTEAQVDANAVFIVRACNNAQRLADALAPFADLLENPDEYRGARADLVVHVADIKAAVKALAQWEATDCPALAQERIDIKLASQLQRTLDEQKSRIVNDTVQAKV